MKRPLVLVSILVLLVTANVAVGQNSAVPPLAKDDKSAVQHGAQPNPGEVRPGTPEGDSPSASAGELVRKQERRIIGLPVNAALVIAGVLIAIGVVGALAVPRARRRDQARGNGTYGRS